jgi:hypothetical protein
MVVVGSERSNARRRSSVFPELSPEFFGEAESFSGVSPELFCETGRVSGFSPELMRYDVAVTRRENLKKSLHSVRMKGERCETNQAGFTTCLHAS